jgi:hypothetical protein
LFTFCGQHGATSLIFVYELLSLSAVSYLKEALSTTKAMPCKAFIR